MPKDTKQSATQGPGTGASGRAKVTKAAQAAREPVSTLQVPGSPLLPMHQSPKPMCGGGPGDCWKAAEKTLGTPRRAESEQGMRCLGGKGQRSGGWGREEDGAKAQGKGCR